MAGLFLRIEPHGAKPFRRRAEGDSLVVGRSSRVDVAIPDPRISRRQARLFRNGALWYIEDLGGRNPTLLNGSVLTEPSPIGNDDVIGIFNTRIVVESVDGAAQPPSAARGGGTIYRPASDVLAASEAPRDNAGGAELRSHTERLRALNAFHRELALSGDLKSVLELVLERAFVDLRPEDGVILLKQADGSLRQAAVRTTREAADRSLYSRHLAHEVVEKGLAALSSDVQADERFARSESLARSGIRSLVAAPLLDTEGCLGMIALSSRAAARRFSGRDLEELVSLASVAALRVRNLALAEEAAQRRALEKELMLARQIQMDLLPSALPAVAGFALHASNLPTRAVSGDLYLVQVRKEGGECVLLMVDVAGKGLSASLLTASVEAWASLLIEAGEPPGAMCRTLSRRLHARTSAERYATGFVAVLDPARGRLAWANAGHNPALVLRASGAVDELPATGLPLGLFPASDYEQQEHVLEPGDLLLIYTDGIVEVASPSGEEYGRDRLIALCRAHERDTPAEVVGALQADLEAFAAGTPFTDDRTLILLRRDALGGRQEGASVEGAA